MATRLRFASSGTAPALPAFHAGWNHTGDAARYPLTTTKQDTALIAPSYLKGAGNNRALGQFVSEPLEAQTISGSATMAIVAWQTAALGAYLQMRISVCSNDGGTIRAVLFAGRTEAASVTTPTTAPNLQFVQVATQASATVRVQTGTLTDYTCIEGDRLVVEIGFWHSYTGGFDRRGLLAWGDPAAGTDLPQTVNDTSVNGVPWIEFTDDIAFASDQTTTIAQIGAVEATVLTESMNSVTVDCPVGVAESDILLATVHCLNTLGTPPSGWEVLESDSVDNGISTHTARGYLLKKTATSSEPATYTFPFTGTNSGVSATVVAYRGAVIAGSGKRVTMSNSASGGFSFTVDQDITDGVLFVANICGYNHGDVWQSPGERLWRAVFTSERDSHGTAVIMNAVAPSGTVPPITHNSVGAHNHVDLAVMLAPGVEEPPPPLVAWDGDSYIEVELLGWWDGDSIEPVEAVGWWDGSTIAPIEPPS